MFVEQEVLTVESAAKRRMEDGTTAGMSVFIARPKEETTVARPALLLIQEVFGVNEYIRDMCKRFARQGYVVVSPDLYYRTGKWLTYDYSNSRVSVGARNELTEPRVIGDLGAALDFIEQLPGVDASRIGVLGFCLGGRLTYVTASEYPDRVKAGAIFYGGGIVPPQTEPFFSSPPLEKVAQIKAALIGFFGGKDVFIPVSAVETFDRALEQANVKHELHIYPDAEHAFFNDHKASFIPSAAADAWHRTLNWFESHLGPVPPIR